MEKELFFAFYTATAYCHMSTFIHLIHFSYCFFYCHIFCHSLTFFYLLYIVFEKKLITRSSKLKERFIKKQSRHYSISVLMNASSGLWGMLLVMLNQWWMLKKLYKNLGENLYIEKKVDRLTSKSVFVFKITSCDLLGILYRIYMFHLFEKNFKSKRKRERKRSTKGREKRIGHLDYLVINFFSILSDFTPLFTSIHCFIVYLF